MPYRPQKRRASRTGKRTGTGPHHRGSFAARVALKRSQEKRKKGSSGPSAILALFLILMVSGVTVASAAVITAGGAAAVTLTQLEEGLPDPRSFKDLDFKEQSVMYSRDGVKLAEFWNDRRDVIDRFQEIPKVVLDATTATEDDTFWTNPGVDLEATVGQLFTVAGGGDARGASTITQQLVRAVLLPEDVLQGQFESDEGLYTRKAKEIIQAYRLTQAFPGEEGKQEIITAYLNQIPYGGAVHGIRAAADVYLGKDLEELTLAETALLAAIPQTPAVFYPYAKNAKGGYANLTKIKKGSGKNKKIKYVIRHCPDSKPSCVETEVVQRQHFILDRLADGKGRWVKPTDEQIEAAKNERIFVKKEQGVRYKAPQFVNAALKEVELILGNDYDPVKDGGYRIKTTLDYEAQKLGEDIIWAGAVAPHLPATEMYSGLRKRGLQSESGWVTRLRALGVYSGALVAMDYRSGDVLAYVAAPPGYYKKNKNQRVDYQYDHIGLGKRQPGSSWKPIVYATGIDTGALTAASVLLDITTPFGGRNDEGQQWVPKNAEQTDSGPIAVRDALQKSLNVPAIRALAQTGVKAVRQYAVKAGYEFIPEPVGFGNKALDVAGLAGAIGTVEVRPLDHVKAFGAFGNNGKVTRPRYILQIKDPNGNNIYNAGKPVTTQVWSPQTAYIVTDILKGNADPRENPAWADTFAMYNTKNGARRELAVKTGTTNNLKDYSTYGYLPKPNNDKQPALAVGVWYGNSNSRAPNITSPPIYSMSNAGESWHAFVSRYMAGKAAPTFKPPKTGVVSASVRTPAGTRTELFVRGTQPGGNKQVDPAFSCGSITALEVPGAWWPSSAINSWAARGVGSSSQWGTIKTGSCGYSSAAPSTPSGSSSSSSSDGSSSGGGSSSSGGGGGASPTCQPGFTDKPKGCVIPG